MTDLTTALAVLLEIRDDIRDDIRGLRADVARLLSDSGTLGDDKAALVSALAASTQGLKFCVSELLLHAEVVADRSADLRLRAAIVAACSFCNWADNRYFDQAEGRGLAFQGLSQDQLVRQRLPFVERTRAAYREFWEKNVASPDSTNEPSG